LDGIRRRLPELIDQVAELLGISSGEVFERLVSIEIVNNVAGVRVAPPPPFDFYRVSAREPTLDDGDPGEPVLGHPAQTPQAKLAGMQLGHFAAFVKRSWRANDWMWGRLDGITWMGRILFDGETEVEDRNEWVKREQVKVLREELPELAHAVDQDERQQFSATADLALWRHEHDALLSALMESKENGSDEAVICAFRACVLRADRVSEEAGSRAGVATASRIAAVASRAFSGAGSALPGPVRGMVGTTRRATGLMNSLAVTFALAPAVGMAVVFLLAAFAVALWVSDGAGALLSPALIALALLSAWSGFGWLSSPPNLVRAVLLTALLALLVWIVATTLGPDAVGLRPRTWFDFDHLGTGWSIVWVLALVASGAGVVLAAIYLIAPLVKQPSAARAVRSWLGYALVVLLAVALLKLGWDSAVAADAGKEAGWKGWFSKHTVIEGALVAVVTACLVIPLAELLSYAWAKAIRKTGP
jgi:hypothetical protein